MIETVALREVAVIRTGVLPPKPIAGDEAEVSLVPVAQILDGRLEPKGYEATITAATWVGEGPGTSARLRPLDVLVSLRMQNFAVDVDEAALGSDVVYATADSAVVRFEGGGLRPGYLVAFLSQSHVQATLEHYRRPSGAPRLPVHKLADLEVPVPSADQQLALAGLVQAAREERRLMQEIQARQQVLREAQLRSAFGTLR